MASLAIPGKLAALLIGLVIIELYSAFRPPDPQLAAQSGSQLTVKIGSFAGPPFSTLSALRAVVLARPLFAPSRRPAAAPSETAATGPELPRLSGIIITPTEKIAVFSPSTGGPIFATENFWLGPFTVRSITAGSVTVTGPEGVIVLHLNPGPQGVSANPAPDMTVLPGGIDAYLIKLPLDPANTN